MGERREITDRLKDKVQLLISLYERTKAEHDALAADKKKLEARVEKQQQALADLEDKYNKAQLAGAFKATSADTKDAKLKVGKIIKEIDKCIALLNK